MVHKHITVTLTYLPSSSIIETIAKFVAMVTAVSSVVISTVNVSDCSSWMESSSSVNSVHISVSS